MNNIKKNDTKKNAPYWLFVGMFVSDVVFLAWDLYQDRKASKGKK